jgi:IclR family acetate operon transcriptional repressor
VCIDSVHGSVVRFSPLSEPMPLHAGTGSRLLLSFLSDEKVESYIEKASPLQKIMPTTITDPGELREEVQLVRVRGFSRGYGDFTTGANYLSFPVIGPLNRPLAAFTIGGPVSQFTREIADSMVPAIQAVMSQLNQQSRFFPSLPLIRF